MAELSTTPGRVDALAFYLPQFHPIPENDAWWGPGFTEWVNVVNAKPAFPGHEHPRLPGELGFYDLRLPEVREAQAALAAEHGIAGFIYHHYWFAGRRLLERPFHEVLQSGRPDFPFALCWANESWTRRWDGSHSELLIMQEYGEEEMRAHAAWLATAFADRRYITIEGRPLLLIFRVQAFPGAPGTYVRSLKDACIEAGSKEPWVVQAEVKETTLAPAENACDAEAEFHPGRIAELPVPAVVPAAGETAEFAFDYDDYRASALARPAPAWRRYPCVVPGWDNTARRRPGERLILRGSTPQAYEAWLRDLVDRERQNGGGLVLINAWNEWAECAYLEPDRAHGRSYLQGTQRVLGAPPPATEAVDTSPADPAQEGDTLAYRELYARYVALQHDADQQLRRGAEAGDRAAAEANQRFQELWQRHQEAARWRREVERRYRDTQDRNREINQKSRDTRRANRELKQRCRDTAKANARLSARVDELEAALGARGHARPTGLSPRAVAFRIRDALRSLRAR
jgi:hypothetical protein